MKLKRITKRNFNELYNLMEEDFCFEERRTREEQLKTLNNKHYKAYFIYSKQLKQNIGYFCFWNFKKFLFGEHFAINKEQRNNGYGTIFLKKFLNFKKPLIIEVEKPTSTLKKRRIEFYKRLGFVVYDKNYVQPSYHNDNKTVPMYIIIYNANISKDEYNNYINLIKKNVYNINS